MLNLFAQAQHIVELVSPSKLVDSHITLLIWKWVERGLREERDTKQCRDGDKRLESKVKYEIEHEERDDGYYVTCKPITLSSFIYIH